VIGRAVFAAILVSALSAPPAATQARAAAPAPAPATALGSLSRSFRQLAERVSPAVVQISAVALAPTGGGPTPAEASWGSQRRGGSGILVSADGTILTNAHVVEGASRLEVTLAAPASAGAPGRSILRGMGRRLPARLVGVDRETDLAVLKVDATGLPFLPLGDSDRVGPGDIVLAFGSPLGLDNSVTMGVVSAVGRQFELDDPMVYIQTDTPINPGNSGGPLVDAAGEVIGVNTLIWSKSGGSEGLGFAAPSNIARAVLNQIRKHGRVRRGVIGVKAQTITPALATALALPQDWGVILSDVAPGSPAERGGLRAGDIALSLDGKAMENGRQFDINVYRRDVGDSATVEIRRGDKRFFARVPVVERQDDPGRFADRVTGDKNLVARLGVLATTVDPTLAPMMPWLREPRGVIVAAWAADAPYVESGVQPGDVILSVNGVDVASLEALNAAVAALRSGQPAALYVDRYGRRLYVTFVAE
jgi:serine protease Do